METAPTLKTKAKHKCHTKRLSKKKKKKKKKNEEEEETMTGSALATSVCSAVATKPAAAQKKSRERSSREHHRHHRLATLLKPRRPSKVTRGRREICVQSNAEDELYVPPGGSIVDASGYEMFSSASGIIRSETQASMVVPRSEAGDPFQMLLRQRIVMLGNQVDDFISDAIISQLLLLNQQDPTKEIKLFINSPGGSVTAGMGIYDAMQFVQAPVGTVCMGLAASMGAFLLTAGEKGKRMSMPNARIMIHQPLGGASGQAVDIEIQAKEMMFHKGRLNQLMAFHSGQPVEKIDADTDRDRYMSPLEAKNYGLIDEVIGGDDAGLKIEGEMADFKKTKAEYVSWGNK